MSQRQTTAHLHGLSPVCNDLRVLVSQNSFRLVRHAAGQAVAVSALQARDTLTHTDGDMGQGCLASEPDRPAAPDQLSHQSQPVLTQASAGRQPLHPSCPGQRMSPILAATGGASMTHKATGLPTAADASAHEAFPQPSSQLLEDTPMELWEYDGSTVASPCSADGCSRFPQPAASGSVEALRELEDFCKCILCDTDCLSVPCLALTYMCAERHHMTCYAA